MNDVYKCACVRCGRTISVGESVYMSKDRSYCSVHCMTHFRCANCKLISPVSWMVKSDQGLAMCSKRCVDTASFKQFLHSSTGEIYVP